MTPLAAPSRARASTPASESNRNDAASLLAAEMITQPAALSTHVGQPITRGIAEFAGSAFSWRARLRQLDRPGVLASLFFAEGLRDVTIALGDGRRARALKGTPPPGRLARLAATASISA